MNIDIQSRKILNNDNPPVLSHVRVKRKESVKILVLVVDVVRQEYHGDDGVRDEGVDPCEEVD